MRSKIFLFIILLLLLMSSVSAGFFSDLWSFTITGAVVGVQEDSSDDQAASDAESARQQQESDAESAQQQQESDAESAQQQQESDAESAQQQQESDAESAQQQQESDAESAQQQQESDEEVEQEEDIVRAPEVEEEIDEEQSNEEKETYTDSEGNIIEIITKTDISADGQETIEVEEIIIGIDGSETVKKTKTENKDNGEIIVSYEEKTVWPDGTESLLKTKTESKEGQEEMSVENIYTDSEGKEIVIKEKTEVEEGEIEVSRSIEVNGVNVDTKLDLKAESKEGETSVKAELSTGEEQDILFFPDEAALVAFEELQSTEGFVFEIKEVTDEDGVKAVFYAEASKGGKLLGIFNTEVHLETLIDTETGEVIKTERPWWAFLVVGADEATVCHVSGENTVITMNILIVDVKSYLEHGDVIGECVAVCNDGILVENVELCEVGDTQTCTTEEGYTGLETCSETCDSYDICESTEFCGDGTLNGQEACDDGNSLDGDGCSSVCLVEDTVEI